MSRRSVSPEQLILDVSEWAATLPDDDQVYVDPCCGHIRIGDVVFADLGSTLDLWTYAGHHLTPESARQLGQALLAWAQSKDRSAAPGERPADPNGDDPNSPSAGTLDP